MENFDQKILNNVLVITVNLSRATVNESAELKNLLTEQIVRGNKKIVADLSQCSSLDSTFIGVLVVSHKELVTKGGELKLVEPLDPAKELLQLTGVAKIFNLYTTIEEAVKSFHQDVSPNEKEKSDFEDKPNKKVDWDFG
ncbi:MAG: STAS domain-containing protein [Ignavibacteriaceae bacterium]|jgi:anti-anti-sigma factor